MQGYRERDGRRVGAATADSRDIAVLVHALEAGDNRNQASVEIGSEALRLDVHDAGATVHVAGQHSNLRAGV